MTKQLDLFEAGSELGMAPAISPDVASPEEHCLPANLAEAFAFYENAVSDFPRSANTRSAFRSIGRVLGLPLEQIPTAAGQLRPLLRNAMPAKAGLKPRNWIQVKSKALSGLRRLGVELAAGRDVTALHPGWAALVDDLPDQSLRIGLSKLLRFLSRNEIAPLVVTRECLEAFGSELEHRSLHPNPKAAYRQTIRHWNKAVSLTPNWPQLARSIGRDPRRYSFEWHEFPASFVKEVEAFLTAKAEADPPVGG